MIQMGAQVSIIDINIIKDNIYQFFQKKISLNFFNIFKFIYFKNKKLLLLKLVLLYFKYKIKLIYIKYFIWGDNFFY